jgi:hypothetical protein
MDLEEVKEKILNSLGKRKFKIISGPPQGTLGELLLNPTEITRYSETGVSFSIEIEDFPLGYYIHPKTVQNKGFLGIDEEEIQFVGIVIRPPIESPIEDLKSNLLPLGTKVKISFNEKTSEGTLEFLY